MADLGALKEAITFSNEICEPNPLVSMILRAHLKIEAEADRLIRLACVKPARLETTKLSASQKFRLCEALWGDPAGDTVYWRSLEALNALRNEIAHGLRQEALEKKLRAFIATIAYEEKDNDGEALEDSLVNCLGYLYQDMTVLEHCCSRT